MTKPDLMAELAEVVRLMKERQDLFDARKYYSGDLLEPRISRAAVELIRTHHAELEAVVRDAARYRWVAKAIPAQICMEALCGGIVPDEVMGEEIDKRIQAMHNSAREGL